MPKRIPNAIVVALRVIPILWSCDGCGGGSPGGIGSGGGAPGGTGGGGGNGVPTVPQGSEPIESFAADKLAALCATAVRCNQIATVSGCLAASLPAFSPQVVQDVQSGVISYDPQLGYRCIQLILVAPCTTGPSGPDLESCHNAFTGTLPAGASCNLNADCVSGECTMPGCTSGCCPPGTCAPGVEVRNVPVGGACFGSGCAEGEYCLTTSGSSGVCKARVAEGGACSATTFCQSGLICWATSDTTTVCRRPASAGESCADTNCTADGSDDCSAADMICLPAPQAGDPCTNGVCGLAFNCVEGACALPGAVGQPCVGDTGTAQCQSGVLTLAAIDYPTCIQGLCALPDPMPGGIACLSP